MIRLLCAEDLNAAVSIWYSASIEAHHFISEEYWHSQINNMRELYLPNCESWVYEANNCVLGFVSYYEESIPALFVDPKAQSQGIGTQLLNFLKQKYDRLNLNVYKENDKTHQFYIYQGFIDGEESICEHTGQIQVAMSWEADS